MKTINNIQIEDMPVAFHIGRGGEFHNQGHRSYVGQGKFIGDFTDDLFIKERNRRGQFVEPEYVTGDGNGVGLTTKEAESGYGSIEIDTNYDITYVCRLADCDEDEVDLILNYDGHVSNEVKAYAEASIDY